MSFLVFLTAFVLIISAAVFVILNRMPFPPILIWSAKMIVVLVAVVTIYVTMRQ